MTCSWCTQYLPWTGTSSKAYVIWEKVVALARVVSVAPQLSSHAHDLFNGQRTGEFDILYSEDSASLSSVQPNLLAELLLALYRLLDCDEKFAPLIRPSKLQVLLGHDDVRIRYLAIRLLCLYLHSSDAAMLKMVERFTGCGPVLGDFEGKAIDYRFFSLWEQKRVKDLQALFESAHRSPRSRTEDGKEVTEDPLLDHWGACFMRFLYAEAGSTSELGLVSTPVTTRNVQRAFNAMSRKRSVLILGPSGSGKSSIVKSIAQSLNKASTMLILHLNDQTDAKLLLGLYTSTGDPSSFKWQPGVLTTAITEGRWVVIEDLDRAPNEILGILLPLLERDELQIPHLGGSVRPAEGFRLFATVRTIANKKGPEALSGVSTLGLRHWSQAQFDVLEDRDLRLICEGLLPNLRAYSLSIIQIYKSLKATHLSHIKPSLAKSNHNRAIGPRDLLRFAIRFEKSLVAAGLKLGNEPIPETTLNSIFLEALDCFLGADHYHKNKIEMATALASVMQFPLEQAVFCIRDRIPEFRIQNNSVRAGRASLRKVQSPNGSRLQSSNSQSRPWVSTKSAARVMESAIVTVNMGEPCLLVGETGTGKTTVVQELARAAGRPLTTINLSQQSEVGDLLGGFKPVSARGIVMPINEIFEDLFTATFSATNNERFLLSLQRTVQKGDWKRTTKLWREALRMADATLKTSASETASRPKRRKIDKTKFEMLKERWKDFASKIEPLEKQIESSSRSFAFSFVEGSLVRAVRQGGWVLLDEINLASSDTLDSLVDLLSNGNGDRPSVLLPEATGTQKVEAHPNFRLFAAMNPATDVGKKELPASLRARFTELYVPSPDQEESDLRQIIAAYLKSFTSNDAKLVSDVASVYRKLRQLQADNELFDGANQKPHFSLRTLTRALVYGLDTAAQYGIRRALYEGIVMSFFTLLSVPSAKLASEIAQVYLFPALSSTSRTDYRKILQREPKCPGSRDDFVQFRHYWMPKGRFPTGDSQRYIITPFVEANLLHLVRASSVRRYPILLQGPTSSGKTSMIEYLAKISGNQFVRVNNHEHTDLQEYLGTYVSDSHGLRFQDGALVRALREGHWLVLDELNLAPTDVLEALNRLLDDNRELLIPETQEVVRPHPDFVLFATQNPPGIYGGRKTLSRAFRNRFIEMHFDDIPQEELETILRERTQIAPSYCTRIVDVYKQLAFLRRSEQLFQEKHGFATLRDLFRWALRDAANVQELAENGYMLLAERVRHESEREQVRAVIENVMRVKLEPSSLYSPEKLRQSGLDFTVPQAQATVWTSGMRRLFVLVFEAVKRNEPVLLVGGTGTGKTSVCQVVADALNQQLHMFNAHQNTETGDLIGAPRPLRNRSTIEQDLHRLLKRALSDIGTSVIEQDFTSAIERYQNVPSDARTRISAETRQAIDEKIDKLQTLFEWCDGNLVTAMKEGSLFLLDEISLAEDAVLERLNSVLEPDRSIFLAEKGAEDCLVTAADGFQFLATMNPGGDHGKKELSPALRNRFTEIWVPPLSQRADIIQIVEAKLGHQLTHLARDIVDFSSWYQETFAGPASSISIREVLSWVSFLHTCSDLEPSLSILHGAALVFLDQIGADPSQKTLNTGNSIAEERSYCLRKLSSIFCHDMERLYNDQIELHVDPSRLVVGSFSIERTDAGTHPLGFAFDSSTTKMNIMRLVRGLRLQKPILLEGAPGVGKTTLVAGLASIVGTRFTRINLSEQTDLMDLFGSDVPLDDDETGRFGWRDGPFLTAMQHGEWVLLDEMNLASQSILEGLNACLDHRGQVFVPELGCSFGKHPAFKLFAAQNPHSQGGGRKGLPSSFVDRFTVIYADTFSTDDLLTICKAVHPEVPTGNVGTITRFLTEANQVVSTNGNAAGASEQFNLRDVLRWLQLLTSRQPFLRSTVPSDFMNVLALNRFRDPKTAAQILEVSQSSFPSRPSPNLHQRINPEYIQCGKILLPRDLAYGRRGRFSSLVNANMLESAMTAVQQNWPCLLVGQSGSGKTQLIQYLGSLVGAKVTTFSINPDMDTTDLVGGYEQASYTREVFEFLKRLRSKLEMMISKRLGDDGEARATAQCLAVLECANASNFAAVNHLLVQLLEDLDFDGFQNLVHQCASLAKQTARSDAPRFAWKDSVIVDAIAHGHWLILDHANMCNPSVLDRLNPLLEPDGVLSLNEHRNADGSGKMIRPHPNFRLFLTMDPRYGEVSHAMRNRCVELFLPTKEAQPPSSHAHLISESSLSRFECFGWFNWSRAGQGEFRALLDVCFENLAFCDYDILHNWHSQVLSGLFELDQSRLSEFESLFQSYASICSSKSLIRQRLFQLYEPFESTMGVKGLSTVLAQVSGRAVREVRTVADLVSCILVCASAQ